MFIAEPILFMIMAAVFYVIWVWKNKPLRVVSYFGRIVFLLSCIIFITYYFLPLPLDAYAFRIYMDPLLPLNEAIKINPVAQIIESKRHLDYYFANLLPLIGGATLFGFSMDLLFCKIYYFFL